ncbi:MAG: hypothetical protein VW618_09685, partial [Alphaproteobacteria bacterium]
VAPTAAAMASAAFFDTFLEAILFPPLPYCRIDDFTHVKFFFLFRQFHGDTTSGIVKQTDEQHCHAARSPMPEFGLTPDACV